MATNVKPRRPGGRKTDLSWLGIGDSNDFFGAPERATKKKRKGSAARSKDKDRSSTADRKLPEIFPKREAHDPPRAGSEQPAYRAPLMTIHEVALELHVSDNHVRNLISEGLVKKILVGVRSVRIARKDVEEIIRNGIWN